MMAFVKNINSFFRRGQYCSTPKCQIRQYQIMVGDDAINFIELLARFKKTAVAYITALSARTLAMVSCYSLPGILFYFKRPVVAVAIPLAFRQSTHQFIVKLFVFKTEFDIVFFVKWNK